MRTIFFRFLILLNIILLTGFGYFVYVDNKYTPPTESQIKTFVNYTRLSSVYAREPELSDEYFSKVKNSATPKLHGWLPWWGMSAGIKKLEEKKELFASISPVFYEINDKGDVLVKKDGLPRLKEVLKDSNVKTIPTISSFDPSGFNKIFGNTEARQKHLDFLVKEIDDNNFDGIDLNYESIYSSDKDNFFDFVKSMSSKMKERKKTFSVTVLSKWGDNINYGFAPQTREVQDYTEIAKYADQVRIMTYDFTSQGSANAGPIAPVEWMEQVLDYTVKRVDPSKVVLGVHLYGYAWPNGEKANALDYRQIASIKRNNVSSQDLYSKNFEEAAIRYNANNKTYFAYYASPESIKARIDLAQKYGIQGVSFWRVGDDAL
jgi:spore germination protein